MNDQLKRILSVSEGEKFEYDPSCTWVDLFLKMVKEHPQDIAVEDAEGVLTYRELDDASNRIAGYLLSSGLKPDGVVGVRMSRNKGFPAVILGIHKAGGAYVPIDLDYPQDRVTYMLADSEARIIINDDSAADAVRTGSPLSPADYRCRPDGLAYMIYTSGSTGRPKGVMIQHKALLNFVHFIRERWHLTADSRIACHSNFAFDASVEDLYPVLTAGGTLVIIPEEIRKDIFEMRAFIQDRHKAFTTPMARRNSPWTRRISNWKREKNTIRFPSAGRCSTARRSSWMKSWNRFPSGRSGSFAFPARSWRWATGNGPT